ncbi:flavin-containing monooxygenase [Halalkalibacter urbisdiaboli]|uniref:flavin-containing monooxygenase n=1 Tax=Halalkalibacter urbisdiaboli TaxID=1960589 RepID=UPI000B44AC48|nr:NAD(P)/FAD-dependent oxidoreductase [Halalkalibacter urbisdiaboli]
MYDVIVIGAGQAGIVTGYYLRKLDKHFLILDKNKEIGDSWAKRYDSLTLFTPRAYSSLPEISLPGDKDGYPNKDEIANYLKNYVETFSLPVLMKTEVLSVRQVKMNQFMVVTNKGEYLSRNIVIATGPFQKPSIPDIQTKLSKEVVQLHSDEYKNSTQLKPGKTLIVGAGNSGVQIATELCEEFDVYLSVGKKNKNLPHKIFNKSIFWWFDVLGLSKATVKSPIGKVLKRNDPIIGKEYKPYVKSGKIKLKRRLKSFSDNRAIFENGEECIADNVIWATGFEFDYSWLHVKNILDKNNKPIHERGCTKVPGIYFVGLPWQHTRGSALITGVSQDAEYITRVMR